MALGHNKKVDHTLLDTLINLNDLVKALSDSKIKDVVKDVKEVTAANEKSKNELDKARNEAQAAAVVAKKENDALSSKIHSLEVTKIATSEAANKAEESLIKLHKEQAALDVAKKAHSDKVAKDAADLSAKADALSKKEQALSSLEKSLNESQKLLDEKISQMRKITG